VADPAPGHEQFVGRLSIPYITPVGVRTIKFRAMNDEPTKYLCLPGARPRMFNVGALLEDSPVVAICEGELDAAVCSSVVGIPAVGVPGVSSWLAHFPRMFSGFDRVLVLSDNDDKPDGHNPGRDMAQRIANDLDQAVVIQPPKGLDVSSWVLRDGADAVRERLTA